MACVGIFRVLGFVALVAAATAQVNSEDDAPSSLMRKHRPNSQMHLGPTGGMQMLQKAHREEQTDQSRSPGEDTWCDTTYPRGLVNTNNCTNPADEHAIVTEEDCRHAASVLNLPTGNHTHFVVKNDWADNNYSKGCVIINHNGTDRVFYNPTENGWNRQSGWVGTPICQYPIYTNGSFGYEIHTTQETNEELVAVNVTNGSNVTLENVTQNVTRDVNHSTTYVECKGDYAAISSYDECKYAKLCQFGGMWCSTPEFSEGTYETPDAPSGCYRSAIGCFGFNANATVPLKKVFEHGVTVVCRLSSFTFTNGTTNAGH